MSVGIFEPKRPYEDWTDEQLRDQYERLYDAMVDGEDVWFDCDQIINELNYREAW
jgi:hypothetical protein